MISGSLPEVVIVDDDQKIENIIVTAPTKTARS